MGGGDGERGEGEQLELLRVTVAGVCSGKDGRRSKAVIVSQTLLAVGLNFGSCPQHRSASSQIASDK